MKGGYYSVDWTTGLTYFWFLHMLWLVLLILTGKKPLRNPQPTTLIMNKSSKLIKYKLLQWNPFLKDAFV